MIRKITSALLSFSLLLASVPSQAQVIAAEAATSAVPRVQVGLGNVLTAPSISVLPNSSVPSLQGAVLPSVVPALTPSALAVSATPSASKAVSVVPSKAAVAVSPVKAAVPSALAQVLHSAPSVQPKTPQEIAALKLAWQSARELLEKVEGAPDSIADAPISAVPTREHMASPEDWRDELFHFVLMDRFARAGKIRTHGDQNSGTSRHGGNIRGAIEQLDYLKGAGVTTLLLSPVNQNLPESYHGYAPVHLMAIDPHMGTMADFKELVNEAHKRGMKVVLDWVLNHSGPVFEYKEGSQWRGLDGQPKEIGEWTETLKPSELMDAKHFTRRGVIDTWSDPEQATHGDFPPNYRHYASDKKETGDLLIHIAKWWVQETDIDGLRVDAVRHIAPGFVPRFSKEIKAFAASLGKKNFFLVGENSTGVDAELLPHVTKDGLDSAFNYPAYRRETYAQHGKAPTRALEDSLHRTFQALGPLAGRLMRFIDLHDVYRFLRLGEPEAQLHVALAYLLFSLGIPMTYYGTEQGFRQDTDRLDPEGPDHPADPGNRADQWGKHDVENSTYKFLAKLSQVRAAYAALRRGEQWVRWSDAGKTGLYAFSRIHDGQEVVVAINFGASAVEETMWVDAKISPEGTRFKDALDSSYAAAAFNPAGKDVAGSQIKVSVPPMSVRVLVRDAK